MSIRENLERVRERIVTAARRANRNPEEVQLLAVSKTFAATDIREAHEAGQRLFGENRVQELRKSTARWLDCPVRSGT